MTQDGLGMQTTKKRLCDLEEMKLKMKKITIEIQTILKK